MSISKEILTIINSIKETMNDYARSGGIQVGVGDETTKTGEVPTGYDTVPPRLMDLDIAATVSSVGNSYYEEFEDVAYYATTVGVGKKAKSNGFVDPNPRGDRVYFSKSKAVEDFSRRGKSFGLSSFALVFVNKDKCNLDGTFTERLRVIGVEYMPI